MNTDTKNTIMRGLVDKIPEHGIYEGELVDGTVIGITDREVYVDLAPYGTGIIYGREFLGARDIIRNIAMGDAVKAKVVERENEDGYIELSLEEAKQALIWREADTAIAEETILALPIKDANKGGLIMEWQGIAGFLPVSQLKPDKYPRVEGGEKDEILKELKKLVGETIEVTIISANPKEGKLIFSEKGSTGTGASVETLTKYNVGDIVDGTVTGAVDFGLFLKIEDGLEGLVHISEIDWALVENPSALYKVGDEVQAKVIEIKDGKISLSIKQLKESPWVRAANKYKTGEKVSGVVIKFNKYGALVAIEEGVAGLVHHSSFESPEALRGELELGKTYDFTITLFDAQEQKMTLGYEQ